MFSVVLALTQKFPLCFDPPVVFAIIKISCISRSFLTSLHLLQNSRHFSIFSVVFAIIKIPAPIFRCFLSSFVFSSFSDVSSQLYTYLKFPPIPVVSCLPCAYFKVRAIFQRFLSSLHLLYTSQEGHSQHFVSPIAAFFRLRND
jgi:hypothetical protein